MKENLVKELEEKLLEGFDGGRSGIICPFNSLVKVNIVDENNNKIGEDKIEIGKLFYNY